MTMLKILGRKTSSNVQKVLWCCSELDIPFEREDVGGPFGKNNTPEYLARNPNGLVPTIDDDGFVLWESNAIVRYLAAKHGAGTLSPSDPKQRADSDRWMDWASNHGGPVITPVFWALIRTPADQRNMAQITADAEKIGPQFQVLEQGLDGRDYVAGKSFTMGDVIVGVNVYRWYALDVKRPSLPRVE